MMKTSPYKGTKIEEWAAITTTLVAEHPLDLGVLKTIVLQAWDKIFESKIGDLKIGKDIMPNPQMLGFFIEALVAAALERQYPSVWKHGKNKDEKDVVCLHNNDFSIEIKASSSNGKIFGNRSYAQEQSETAKKDKSGYYLTINFSKTDGSIKPEITYIRFGYIEHSDWRAQKSANGQQASLSPEVYKNKFVTIFEKKTKTKLKKD